MSTSCNSSLLAGSIQSQNHLCLRASGSDTSAVYMSSFKLALHHCFLHSYEDRARAFSMLLKKSDSDALTCIHRYFLVLFWFKNRFNIFTSLNQIKCSLTWVVTCWAGCPCPYYSWRCKEGWNNKTASQKKSRLYYTWKKKENVSKARKWICWNR